MRILTVYKKNHESVHDRAFDHVRRTIEDLGLSASFRAREVVQREDVLDVDLVIVLGGDGTLTSISHIIDSETLVMGVNSHPRDEDAEGSLGFFMGSDARTFESDLDAVINGTAEVNLLPRLQAVIETTSGNRIRTDPALNDLFIGNTHQYQPSKYMLRRGGQRWRQQSSGLIFSTYLGRGAWYDHAAGSDALTGVANQAASHYFALAREVLTDMTAPDASRNAWTSEPTTVVSDMHRGYVVADGWDETHFNRGATITVDLSGPVLRLVTIRGRLTSS